uniref:Family with sequence similarity 72 member A n=1 Tax=Nomascus leucogenys TaxID=61853 RepID=A0A2I3FSX8_NOMLE
MPTTTAPRWTAAARSRRNGRGGWVRAPQSVSQDRVPGCTVMGGETRSPEKSMPQSLEEPPPTPQDPAGK